MASTQSARFPLQPLERDEDGTVRFKANRIVRYLLETSKDDMNSLARMGFSGEEWEQFAQLIGYSLSGFGELSYVSDEAYDEAENRAEEL